MLEFVAEYFGKPPAEFIVLSLWTVKIITKIRFCIKQVHPEEKLQGQYLRITIENNGEIRRLRREVTICCKYLKYSKIVFVKAADIEAWST